MTHDSYALSNGGTGMLNHSTGLYDVGLLDLGPHPPPSIGTFRSTHYEGAYV